jgi:hypothetical protein
MRHACETEARKFGAMHLIRGCGQLLMPAALRGVAASQNNVACRGARPDGHKPIDHEWSLQTDSQALNGQPTQTIPH